MSYGMQGVGNLRAGVPFLRLTAWTPFPVSREMLHAFQACWKSLDLPKVLVLETDPRPDSQPNPAWHSNYGNGVVMKLLPKSSMLIAVQLDGTCVIPVKSV